jgi:hypothetical protein
MKKYLLAMAAMLAISGINAQEMKSQWTVCKASSCEMNNLKKHIEACNLALGDKYKSADIVNVCKSMQRLMTLAPFNQQLEAPMYEKSQIQIHANLVKLDTVQSGYFSAYKSVLLSKGYEYATAFNSPGAHYDYDAVTRKWTVTPAASDVQLTFTEANGAKSTIIITPKSDKYVSVLDLSTIQTMKPYKSKTFSDVLQCQCYNMKVVSNGVTLMSCDISHPLSFVQSGINISNQTDLEADIKGCILRYQRKAKDESGIQPYDLSLSRNGKTIITNKFKVDLREYNMKDLSYNLLGKIQLRGNVHDMQKVYMNLMHTTANKDSSAMAAYADALNSEVNLSYYYDGNKTKVGDNHFFVSAIGDGTYKILPAMIPIGSSSYVPFTQYMKQQKDAAAYELFMGLNRDVNFGIVSLIGALNQGAVYSFAENVK